MTPTELSEEQERLLDPGVRVVEAGPGSGKTRALVARYLASAASARRGVALLSFTNAAVNEVRRRSHSSAHLLRAPHFVGTIDSFLHRFIVTPAETGRLGRLPTYRASWDDLPTDLSVVRLGSVPGVGIRLSRFRLDPSGSVSMQATDWQELQYLREVEDSGGTQQLLNLAGAKIKGFTSRGLYDAGAARDKAYSLIESGQGEVLVQRITSRFEEVLVDEAQDCDVAEIGIIRRLSRAVKTMVVADPDQAIFEFRGSSPQVFLDYRNEHAPEKSVQLSINYRSTEAICKAVDSLRAAGTAPIIAAVSDPCPPVYVLSGDGPTQRESFRTILDEHSIAADSAIVLSHSRKDAETVADRRPREGSSQAIGNLLAANCHVLARQGSSPDDRLKAITNLENLVLSLIEWPEELRVSEQSTHLKTLGCRLDWVRLAAARLVGELTPIRDRDEFGRTARSVLEDLLSPLPISHVSLGNKVKKPSPTVWNRCVDQTEGEQNALLCETIHGAKGLEFEAVLLALPGTLRQIDDRDVLNDWEDGINSEPRRVLYVGASRAKRVLAFGAGPHVDRVVALLSSAGALVEVR